MVIGLSPVFPVVRAGHAHWSFLATSSLGGLQFSLKGHKTVLLKIARRKAGKDYTQQFSSGTTLAT
ncbi:hypothetical protein IE980_08930 [Klebsiella pneumoniae]|uniref:Uncharacterized protein n=1 Tax=Klebsiella pneumoniae TaxID=573 RepID=A0A927E4B2_KLEPN|nr:hypothetical protein [Klebsiella pneumoniae]